MFRCILLIFNILLINNQSFAYPNNINSSLIPLEDEQKLPSYILGPGDKLLIKVYKMKEFDVALEVLPDGTINLPRVGPISVNNLTLEEAKIKIKKGYEKILKRPIIYLDLVQFRPISLLVTGEVQKPGIYSMGLNRINKIESSTGGEALNINSKGWPTVIDAIQLAGGLTDNADLKNIFLKRNNSENHSNNSLKINLLDLITNGEISENLYVYSGDSIKVLKASKNDFKKLISKSNLAPSTILVNVVGEVENPGNQKVKANSQPISAILSAGGLKRTANINKIKLLRLNQNGSVFTKEFKYKNLTNGNLNNFSLIDKDIIFIPPTNWAKTRSSFADLTDPFLRSLQILRLF